ncbi:MAG TPA: alpha/beta hydrolase [Planctomycetota bacterium]|nr:alpha/beta hydrolase [Planctomycetota bacterium]
MRLVVLLTASILVLGCGSPPPRSVAQPDGVAIERDIVYHRVGDRDLRLDLYRPEGVSGPLPVIVWIFGGGWLRGGRETCPIAPIARRGVVIASIDYRLADQATFPAQIEDCKAAVRFLRANAGRLGIDGDRIGSFGVSAGGHLAALLGTSADVPELDAGGDATVSDAVSFVVACFPATDLAGLCELDGSGDWRMRLAVRMLLGGDPAEKPELAALASPTTHASAGDAPFLLLHGTRDGFVPTWQSRVLHAGLRGAGVPSRLVLVEGEPHGAWLLANDDVKKAIDRFLDERLGATTDR